MSESARSSIPEDAFYQDPFSVDEGDQVQMKDVDHDMFCTFAYVRHRFDVSTDSNGQFVFQWWPMLSKSSMRVGLLNVWTNQDPTWLASFQANYSHIRVMGAAVRFVPTMAQDSGKGEVTFGMYFPSVPNTLNGTTLGQAQIGDTIPALPGSALTDVRGRRGYVSASAMSGLQGNYRHLKMFLPFSKYVPNADGTSNALALTSFDSFNFDPHSFFPTWIGNNIPLKYVNSGVVSTGTYGDQFPSCVLVGDGMPVSQQVGTVEVVLGVCGVAMSTAVASRTPMPVFLGCPLTQDNLSNVPSRQEGLRRALVGRAEARGKMLWQALDIASTITRSLAPVGAMVNPAVGGALLGASAFASGASSTIRNFMSG